MKNISRILFVLLCTLLVGCKQSVSVKIVQPSGDLNKQTEISNKSDSPTKIGEIPNSLVEFVKKSLPKMKIPTVDNYLKDWESFSNESDIPYYCKGDFNGDKLIDYCLLMIKDSTKINLYSFLNQNNSFQIVLIDSIRYLTKGIDIIVTMEPKGEWESIEETFSVPFDGIHIDLIEESISWSYYLKKERFERFYYD